MKTLIFCTSYAPNPQTWQLRHLRWAEAIRASGLACDQILIVDDGSPSLPSWPELTIAASGDFPTPGSAPVPGGILLYHFAEHAGRPSLYDFPGWHRSFTFAALYGQAHGFERIIHIESDAFLLTTRVRDYFNNLTEGWVALYCDKYKFPEVAIQAAAGASVSRLAAWARAPYDNIRGRSHEDLLPYTKVERGFVGDRYGEHLQVIPREADYAAQVQIGREAAYYWWLSAPLVETPRPGLVLDFGRDGNAAPSVGAGWSYAEEKLRWMIGPHSELRLPGFADGGRGAKLSLHVLPHVFGAALPRQRLDVTLNGVAIGQFEVVAERTVECAVPAGLLRATGENQLGLLHPDWATPVAISGNADTRPLALAVVKARLVTI